MRACRWLMALIVAFTAAAAAAGWEEGVAAFRSADYTTASQHFSDLLKVNPNLHEALYMLGRCQERLGQNAEALASLSRAAELKPESAQYKVALGSVLLANQRAADAFEVLHVLDPAQMDPALRLPHALLLADSAFRVDRPADALPALQGALTESEGNPALSKALAAAFSKLGRSADAATTWAACFAADAADLESGRRSVEAAIAAADATLSEQEQRRMRELAVTTATRLTELAPTGQHFYLLGRSLAAAGETDAALVRLEAALAAGVDENAAVWIHGQLARRSECRLDIQEAIRHHDLAGNRTRAQELRQLSGSFGEVLAQRQELAETIGSLRAMLPELEQIDEKVGADAVRGKIAGLQRELAVIDANLGEVRSALQAGCDDR